MTSCTATRWFNQVFPLEIIPYRLVTATELLNGRDRIWAPTIRHFTPAPVLVHWICSLLENVSSRCSIQCVTSLLSRTAPVLLTGKRSSTLLRNQTLSIILTIFRPYRLSQNGFRLSSATVIHPIPILP